MGTNEVSLLIILFCEYSFKAKEVFMFFFIASKGAKPTLVVTIFRNKNNLDCCCCFGGSQWKSESSGHSLVFSWALLAYDFVCSKGSSGKSGGHLLLWANLITLAPHETKGREGHWKQIQSQEPRDRWLWLNSPHNHFIPSSECNTSWFSSWFLFFMGKRTMTRLRALNFLEGRLSSHLEYHRPHLVSRFVEQSSTLWSLGGPRQMPFYLKSNQIHCSFSIMDLMLYFSWYVKYEQKISLGKI